MSAGVAVRGTSGPPVFSSSERAHAWLGGLAERHGLDLEGADTEWLLLRERLNLEVLAPGRDGSGQVSECFVTHRLSCDEPAQGSEASLQLRAVLTDLLGLAAEVGGELRATDDDMLLRGEDLDWYAGLTDDATAGEAAPARPAAEFLGVDHHELTKEQAQDLMTAGSPHHGRSGDPSTTSGDEASAGSRCRFPAQAGPSNAGASLRRTPSANRVRLEAEGPDARSGFGAARPGESVCHRPTHPPQTHPEEHR